MLILAREARGYTQSQLAKMLRVTQGALSKIETGLVLPIEGFIESAAEVLEFPSKFFFQNDPIYGFGSTVFYHRKRKGLPIKTLRQLHAHVNIRRNHIKRLLRSLDMDSWREFRQIDTEDFSGNIRRIAQAVRAIWKLPIGPVRSLINAIEQNGAIIVACDFGTRRIDAISEWTEMCPPLFFVNYHYEITGDRLRYSLAHEIGHMVLHRYPKDRDMETEADTFASEFLMPSQEIKPYLYRLNLAKLAALKREWKVSMAALVEKAYELGTISVDQRRYLIINLRRQTHSFREPPETDIPIERPTLLPAMVKNHVESLGYTVAELSELVAEREQNFRDMYLPSAKVANIRN